MADSLAGADSMVEEAALDPRYQNCFRWGGFTTKGVSHILAVSFMRTLRKENIGCKASLFSFFLHFDNLMNIFDTVFVYICSIYNNLQGL